MVLRDEAVQQRLKRLEEVMTGLEELSTVGAARGDLSHTWAVERGLHLGAEIVFDIGNHILSAHFGVTTANYREIVEQLADRGVLPEVLRHRLAGLAGFRNILVHDYLRIDPDLALQALRRAPADFGEFARAVRSWLEGSGWGAAS